MVVVWDRDDYIKGGEKQLGDKDIYEVCTDPGPLISIIHENWENSEKRWPECRYSYIFYVERPKVCSLLLAPENT